jgi:hypothetical protein
MKRFARLFDFSGGQLLLTVGEIDDIPGTTLNVETQHNGCDIGTGLPFDNRADAEAAMAEMTTEKAEELHTAMVDCIGDPKQLTKIRTSFVDIRNAEQA